MTWHLKDRELEKKLIELYPNFLDGLELGVRNKGNFPALTVVCTRVRQNDEIPQDEISFWFDEIVEEPLGYNPNAWNEYPKVKPPENIPMRIECTFRYKTFYECGIFIDGNWHLKNDGRPVSDFYNRVKRFRPWRD